MLSPDFRLPSDIPFYAVGPATKRQLLAIPTMVAKQVRGAESGNGGVLAGYMLRDYNALEQGRALARPKLPLLFLVGEQRRDIIPKTLMSTELAVDERIQVEELEVYKTEVMQSLAMDLTQALRDARNSFRWIYLIVFSTTGSEVIKQVLNEFSNHDCKRHNIDAVEKPPKGAHLSVITIGPTTRDYWKKVLQMEPNASADTPSALGVLRAVPAGSGHLLGASLSENETLK